MQYFKNTKVLIKTVLGTRGVEVISAQGCTWFAYMYLEFTKVMRHLILKWLYESAGCRRRIYVCPCVFQELLSSCLELFLHISMDEGCCVVTYVLTYGLGRGCCSKLCRYGRSRQRITEPKCPKHNLAPNLIYSAESEYRGRCFFSPESR